MTHQRLRTLLATLGVTALMTLPRVNAQTPAAAAPEAANNNAASESAIQLPAFEISSEKDQSYVGTSSLSSTRVAVDLSELAQSVKVLNNSFLTAINPTMMSDILDYVGGGQNGQLNWTPGRMNIRGFTGDADYVDGFAPGAATALDSFPYDRFEVIKGPSAIFLAADGSPGGVVNKITKDPQEKSATSIMAQTGLYDGNEVALDSTGAITKDGKLTYRIIGAESYWNDYYDYVYMHRFTGMFALSYKFNENTKLTIKAEDSQANWPSYNGLPIDPRTLQMIALPYNSTQDLNAPQNWRHDDVKRIWGSFNTRLNQYIAVSVRGMRAFDRADRLESIAPTWNEGTATGTALINGVSTPVTFLGGRWTTPATVGTSETTAPVNYVVKNGVTYVTDSWAGVSNYAGGAIPRSTMNVDDSHGTYNDIQADVNFNYDSKYFKELLLVGGEHRDAPGETETWKTGVSSSAWYPYAPGTPATVVTNYVTPSAYTQSLSLQNRGYILETLKALDDRVILSYGLSRACTYSGSFNYLTGAWTGAPGGYNINKNLVQYGLVVKVLPGVSLFTGYNQNFAVNGTGTLNGVVNQPLPAKSGKQHEVGVKTEFLNKKITINVSYFDVQQQNNTVPSFPSDPLNPNVLIPGVISRGFDGDMTFAVSSNLYLIGTFANYSAKSILSPAYDGAQGGLFVQPGTGHVAYGSIPVDNTAEQTESLYGLYKFTSGKLKGLQIGLGENFQSKRAITDGPDQVFWGYLPARTVVDSNISYTYNSHIKYTVTINNLLDKKYIYSSRSEDVIVPGEPINIKVAITYSL